MNTSLIRIDNRLVHGQILEAWVPFVGASHIVVVNDEIVEDPFRETVIRMAVPQQIKTHIHGIDEFSQKRIYKKYLEEKSIILFEGIDDILNACRRGFTFSSLNIGNVYANNGIYHPTPSISLNEENVNGLLWLVQEGVKIELRCVPRDRPIDFLRVSKKFHTVHPRG